MSEKTEYVEVTLRLPKGLLEFLEDMKACFDCSVKEYMEYSLIDTLRAQIDADFVFSPTVERVSKRYEIKFDC